MTLERSHIESVRKRSLLPVTSQFTILSKFYTETTTKHLIISHWQTRHAATQRAPERINRKGSRLRFINLDFWSRKLDRRLRALGRPPQESLKGQVPIILEAFLHLPWINSSGCVHARVYVSAPACVGSAGSVSLNKIAARFNYFWEKEQRPTRAWL